MHQLNLDLRVRQPPLPAAPGGVRIGVDSGAVRRAARRAGLRAVWRWAAYRDFKANLAALTDVFSAECSPVLGCIHKTPRYDDHPTCDGSFVVGLSSYWPLLCVGVVGCQGSTLGRPRSGMA